MKVEGLDSNKIPSSLMAEAISDAYDSLPPEEREQIDASTASLLDERSKGKRLKGVGQVTAHEILASIGAILPPEEQKLP